jgi:hypothetical protein
LLRPLEPLRDVLPQVWVDAIVQTVAGQQQVEEVAVRQWQTIDSIVVACQKS